MHFKKKIYYKNNAKLKKNLQDYKIIGFSIIL